jgi:hypothetical protein
MKYFPIYYRSDTMTCVWKECNFHYGRKRKNENLAAAPNYSDARRVTGQPL